MLDILTKQRDKILPPPDVLHERSKIWSDLVTVNGRRLELPRFANEIKSQFIDSDSKGITFKGGRIAGERLRFDTITDGGIDRGVSVYIPDDSIDQHLPHTLLMDTAWFTGLEGHNDRIGEILMKQLGARVVLVGPEFSAFEPEKIDAEMNLAKLALTSTGISLMQSAEASAAIYDHLKTKYPDLELTDNVYDVGESRGAMVAQLRRIYSECFGNKSVGSDLTDPNMAERAFMKFSDSIKLLKWPVREAAGMASVAISNAMRGEISHMAGTVPMDLRYMVGAIAGTGPALFSGEDGLGARYTDYAHPQFTLNFKGSGAAHSATRRMNYQSHFNASFMERRGCHLSLAHPSVLSYLIARGLAHADATHNGLELTPDIIASIHATKPTKTVRRKVELATAA